MSSMRVLVVGASDTGRSPLAAALLDRLVQQHGLPWVIESAGLVGHDGDPLQSEAQHALEQLGLSWFDHRARSLNDELVAQAQLLVTIDHGIGKALRARFPQGASRTFSLGELAQRPRDIPDPFRMQIGAWIAYARELDELIQAAWPRMLELVETPATLPEAQAEASSEAIPTIVAAAVPAPPQPPSLAAPATPLDSAFALAISWPEVIVWEVLRSRIERQLQHPPTNPLSPVYVALIRAALALTHHPRPGQLAALRHSLAQLESGPQADDVATLSEQIGKWATL